jgi:hypothetical protein
MPPRDRLPRTRMVLLVDEDEPRRVSLRRRLERRSFAASAASLDEALLLLNLHTPRLIVLGKLPKGDTNLLLHALTRNPRLGRTRLRAWARVVGADHGNGLRFTFKRRVAA